MNLRPKRDLDRGARDNSLKSIDLGHLPELVGYRLRRAQLAIFQDFMNSFQEVGIRPTQYAVLTVVEHNPGLKQSEVSAALGIKRANLVALLDSLEERGLARRAAAAEDRRSYELYLTSKGAALMQRLRQINAAHERRVIATIGEDGRKQLLKLLAGVLDAVGSAPQEEEET
jgi:DNA-binding MarR family transcriptional regulator